MWETASKALQWLIETLLSQRVAMAARREKQWTQVVDSITDFCVGFRYA